MAIAWPGAWIVLTVIAIFVSLTFLLVAVESVADEHIQQVKRWFNEGPA
jgi:hypothetical protein